ncbi:MAG: tripartite tricarboxylate transporter substrate binding protein [Deltaproteobacteria bacterium]|nr:tripartite tricarboxylate transporter substrate binding protein [Deltaproteobacteria bacterium]MDZ4347201.1 tripartite tricarboxylate transporter substrate binding protein [Candidatus Binatia bacterium]
MIVVHAAAKFRLEGKLRATALTGVLVAGAFLTGPILPAAEYPTKTIQVINPYPPGAVTDIIARILAPRMSFALGQQLVIINKAGGGGAVGIHAAKEAAPDGYTILVTPPPILLIPIVNKNSGFTTKDFVPIALATSSPNTTVVKADAPWKRLEEFIADAKKKPGELTYGSAGPGTTPHFIGELVKLKTGIDLTHVPLGSESAAATAVLGGHVNISFLTLGTTRSHIEAGTLRALAVASNRRLKDFPNVPTTVEKGFPELNLKVWVGFFAPAKTPAPVVKRLAGVISDSLKDPEVVAHIEKSQALVENLGPQEAAKFYADEERKWSEVARVAKISN